MDLLQQAAAAYSNIMNFEYYITVGKNGKSTSYVLQFNEDEFKHIAGLHKLTDLDDIRRSSSRKLLIDISQSNLTLMDIQDSIAYANIENRLRNLPYLEHYLDNFDTIYDWNKNKSPFSKINANIMIPCKSQVKNNETAYAFFENTNGNELHLTDYFTETAKIENVVTLISDEKDYTKGQVRPPKLLYKAKINKTTGDKTVFIDKLSERTANNSLTKPDNPMYDIVKNLNTISSDKILNHPEALTDLYELTLQEKPTTDIIYQISHETKQPFDSFDTFTSNKAALEQAYNHITDIENKPAFADTYDRLEKFITPFRDKDPNSLIWSTEAARWERFLEYGNNTNKPLTTISPSPPSTTVNNNTSTSKPNNNSINNKPKNVVKSSRFNSVINDSSFAPQDISPAFDPSNPYN